MRGILRPLAFTLLAASAFGVNIPRPGGELAIQLPFGGSISLSQYKGKVVVLAFIQTTCPHCQTTTQLLTRIQNEYGPKGVQVVEGAFNADAKQKLPEFLNQYKPSFPVGVVDPNTVLNYSQITPDMRPSVPIMFFIDRQGTIRAQFFGNEKFFEGDQNANMRAQIDLLLSENAAPAAKNAAPGKKK